MGGNVGAVNNFTDIDIANISGGVYSSQGLSQGNNLACFAMQFATQAAPDMEKRSAVLGDIMNALTSLNSQVVESLQGLSCSQLTTIDQSQFMQSPGYTYENCQTGEYN